MRLGKVFSDFAAKLGLRQTTSAGFKAVGKNLTEPDGDEWAQGTKHAFTINLDSANMAQPPRIEFRMFPMKASAGDKEPWRILINTKNFRHPFDRHIGLGLFGPETMNPALLPAYNLIGKILRSARNEGMKRRGILEAQSSFLPSPEVCMESDGWSLCIDLNNASPIKPTTYKNIAALYQGLIDNVQEQVPAIQKAIDQHRYLQPTATPTRFDIETYRTDLMEAWGISPRGPSGHKSQQHRPGRLEP